MSEDDDESEYFKPGGPSSVRPLQEWLDLIISSCNQALVQIISLRANIRLQLFQPAITNARLRQTWTNSRLP